MISVKLNRMRHQVADRIGGENKYLHCRFVRFFNYIDANRVITVDIDPTGAVIVARPDDNARVYSLSRFISSVWWLMFVESEGVDHDAWPPVDKPANLTRGDSKTSVEAILGHWSQCHPKHDGYHHDILRATRMIDPYTQVHSCVSGKISLNMYTANEQRVGLFVVFKHGLEAPVGRALLWKADCGTTILDRVYPSDRGPHATYARQMAEDNGWVYRLKDGPQEVALSVDKEFKITLAHALGAYPWQDTFQYVEVTKDSPEIVLSNKVAGNRFIMRDQNGTPPWLPTCSSCGNRDEGRLLENYGAFVCQRCIGRHYAYSRRLSLWIRTNDSHYSYMEYMDDYADLLNDATIHTSFTKLIILRENHVAVRLPDGTEAVELVGSSLIFWNSADHCYEYNTDTIWDIPSATPFASSSTMSYIFSDLKKAIKKTNPR